MSVESEKEELKRLERQRQLAKDCKATFTQFEAGIRVYRWLEDICLKNSQVFAPNHENMTAFNCGAREIILRIDDEICKVDKPPKQETAINKE